MKAFAIFAGVLSVVAMGGGSARAEVGPPITADLVSVGKVLYTQHCASCHGANLEGNPEWRMANPDGTLPPPPHNVNGHTWHHPDQVLFKLVKDGGQATAPQGFVSGMPGFGDVLSDAKIWAVLTFIKSTWPEEARKRQAFVTQQAAKNGK